MSTLRTAVVLAALADLALFAAVLVKLWRVRHRGVPLRFGIFAALAAAALLGAFVTGLYAVGVDSETLGLGRRLVSVAPKAFVLASALLEVAALGASLAGRRLARSMEQLAEAATRIAQGDRATRLPRVRGGEARRITTAIATLQREVENQPYAAAFLRDAWHDLKTPLAAIRATVEVLQDGAVDDPAAARRFVANLSRAAGDLDRKLGDLVTLARLETVGLPERKVLLGTIVRRAMDRMAPLATAKGVAVGTEVRGMRRSRVGQALLPRGDLRCDAPSLERVFANLLENAIDATPGGQVLVSVDEGSRDALVVDVVNEPAAVPHEMRGHLFERVSRSGHDQGRSSGLGLAIARAAVEAHGGRVRFLEMGPPRVRVRVELPR